MREYSSRAWCVEYDCFVRGALIFHLEIRAVVVCALSVSLSMISTLAPHDHEEKTVIPVLGMNECQEKHMHDALFLQMSFAFFFFIDRFAVCGVELFCFCFFLPSFSFFSLSLLLLFSTQHGVVLVCVTLAVGEWVGGLVGWRSSASYLRSNDGVIWG